MDFGEVLFALKARVGRGPFTILTVGGWAMALGFIRYNPIAVLQHGSAQTIAVLGFALLLLWISVAITVKRLHDVGLSGLNTIWIGLLGLVGDPLTTNSPLLMGAAAVSIIAQLWLCIEPDARRANRFGNSVSA